MKLYTEIEITESLESMGLELMVNEFFQMSEPIELPSDDEIANNAYTDRRVEDLEYHEQIWFERGAKWMKEQIFNQNK